MITIEASGMRTITLPDARKMRGRSITLICDGEKWRKIGWFREWLYRIKSKPKPKTAYRYHIIG